MVARDGLYMCSCGLTARHTGQLRTLAYRVGKQRCREVALYRSRTTAARPLVLRARYLPLLFCCCCSELCCAAWSGTCILGLILGP